MVPLFCRDRNTTGRLIHVQVNICPEYNSDKHILRNEVRKEVLKARASFFQELRQNIILKKCFRYRRCTVLLQFKKEIAM